MLKKRFLREAKSAAALDHPYVCNIYEVGEEDGKSFISMEYVQGETLKDKLTDGPLAMKDALQKAAEIAEALEAAHKQTIVHRDLKPSNIMFTPEGHAKVMDFGLAKQLFSAKDVESQEQTITASLTKTGATLGTLAYMSPEQLRGKDVDTRSDIFSFGVVLYEMLTGTHPFQKSAPMDTASSILKEDPPPLSRSMSQVPPVLQRTVRKMLMKEPERRYQHIGDVRIDLEELISDNAEALAEPATPSPTGVPSAIQPPLWRKAFPWAIAFVIAIIAGIAIWISKSPVPQPLVEFMISPPPNTPLLNTQGRNLGISPDGRRIAYQVGRSGRPQLYLRSLDEVVATPIPGTDGMAGSASIFSPDGESVVFVADGKLRKVSLPGGTSVTLCEMTNLFGGSWGPGDVIVLASDEGLYRVSAAGGEPEMLANVDREKGEVEYRQPEVLPDGKTVLFTIGRQNSPQIAVLSLETGEKKILVEGGREAHYAPTGHLVYEAAELGTLMAASFDPERKEITGQSVPVLSGINSERSGTMDYDFSRDGTLVYIPARSEVSTLVWVDRQGKSQPLTDIQRAFNSPQLSPDGRRVAVEIGNTTAANIWIYDIVRATLTPLTFDGVNLSPVWTLDGRRLAFTSDRAGSPNLFWMQADGSGEVERLSTNLERQEPFSWSPDGLLAYLQTKSGMFGDIWILPLKGEGKPREFLATQFFEVVPMFSPDGRWIAFQSNRSGLQMEVYVTPYPGPGGMMQISTDGGINPHWSPNEKELFYRNEDKMMAVSIQTEPTFKAGTPRLLFEEGAFARGPGRNRYDVDSEGRFLMMKEEEQTAGQINVVLNWFEELKRLVPTD